MIVGLVRNGEHSLRGDVERLSAAFAAHARLRWHLIESDSTDRSVEVLRQIASRVDDFSFQSLGQLRERLPLRTARIAHCRNAYLARLRTDAAYRDCDYVAVCDFDGVNDEVTSAAVATCWARSDWDVCGANQRGPYYDVWALRHPVWCPNDCWAHYRFLSRFNPSRSKNFYASVQSRMITIPADLPWIEVESAFGGLALYKRRALEAASYIGLTADGEEVCEHVALHAVIRQAGHRIFINPGLINTSYTDYTRRLKAPQRWLHTLRESAGAARRTLLGR